MHQTARVAQAHLIRAGRLQQGFTQEELARRLEVHPQTVAHLEGGRRLATSEHLVGKLAALFGYHLDQLYIAAHVIPPDMEEWVATNPKLMQQLRELMNRQQAGR